MRFNLEIELDNEEMQSYPNISEALRRVARNMPGSNLDEIPKAGDALYIYDLNGNKVGFWTVTGR